MVYKSNSSKFWTGFLAVLLALVLAGTAALVGVLSDGFKDWSKFKPDEEQTEQTGETAENGGALIGESVGNGVKVLSTKIATADYSVYGISPMGSCIQLIIQMPILFALYRDKSRGHKGSKRRRSLSGIRLRPILPVK